MRILWLRPDKPADISVGRHRIADLLRERGNEVSIWNTRLTHFGSALFEPTDVVIGTSSLGAIVGAWRKLVRGTPLLVDHIDPIQQIRRDHGRIETFAASLGQRIAFRVADHVLVIYDSEVERVSRHATSYSTTNLGVDYDAFAEPAPDIVNAAREVLDGKIGTGRRRAIYVGGLEPIYNLDVVIAAMESLPNWNLVILGDGSQRELISNSGIENVHYLGTVPHETVPGYLHECDVGVCLTRDPNTLKVLEYGAAGLPVLKAAGPAEEVYGDMVTCTRVTPEAVAEGLESALGTSTGALQSYVLQYSWDAITDDYEAALDAIMTEECQ